MNTKFKLEAFIQLRNETRTGYQFHHRYTEPSKGEVNERFKELPN